MQPSSSSTTMETAPERAGARCATGVPMKAVAEVARRAMIAARNIVMVCACVRAAAGVVEVGGRRGVDGVVCFVCLA